MALEERGDENEPEVEDESSRKENKYQEILRNEFVSMKFDLQWPSRFNYDVCTFVGVYWSKR